MSLSPPPQQNEFNWIWQKWLYDVWVNLTGKVDTTGTPANDQVAVFTDEDTIEGSSSLTWDGTTLGVTGAITCNAFTSNGIDDNATVETLQVADGQVAVGNNATEEAVILYVLSDDLYHTYLRFGSDTDATAGQLDYFYNAGSPIFTIGTTVASGEFRLESGNGVTALTLDASQNATFAADVTCNTGAFTSRGIDDNATGERVEISDAAMRFGDGSAEAVYTLEMRGTDDGRLDINGGNLSAATLRLFGSTHATKALDMDFGAAGNIWMTWDEDAGEVQILTGSGSKTLAITINSSQQTIVANRLGINRTPTYLFDAEEESGDAIGRIYASEDINTADAVVRISSTHIDSSGYIQFGDKNDSNAGYLRYNHNTDALTIFTNTALALTLDNAQNATFAGSIEADGNLTLNNSNTSIYLDDTSGSTAGTDRLQLNIDNDIFSIKSRTASTNALNEGVWVATNAAGSLTQQEFYIANSVELTLTAGNATFAGDVKADGYIQSNTATDTELNDIAHAINTNAGKIQGAMVYNTTQDKPVWAVGNADGSVWVDGAGTTANTPVV